MKRWHTLTESKQTDAPLSGLDFHVLKNLTRSFRRDLFFSTMNTDPTQTSAGATENAKKQATSISLIIVTNRPSTMRMRMIYQRLPFYSIFVSLSLFLQVTCFQVAVSPILKTARSFPSRSSSPIQRQRQQHQQLVPGFASSPSPRSQHQIYNVDCFATKLYSLKSVVDEIATNANEKQKTIFVGGKGGVGKTTTSSALAVELAQRGLSVLIVSTDPAHSLGDALDFDLRSSNGRPIKMTDPITLGNLDAAEISAEAALDDFRESLAGFDVERLAQSLGVSSDLLESLGLREFSGLLNSPPPGLDEIVALGNVMSDSAQQYDVVVVDTAPTGHTLRLLALPQFLDGLLGKLIKLRMKLSKLTSTLQSFLGDSGARERAQTIDNAMDKLESFKNRIAQLETNLKDSAKTNFLVVTVPTKLAVDESKRLVTELKSQGIAVNNIVVNQCLGKTEDGESEAISNYYQRRRDGQMKWIDKLKEAAERVSSSEEYRGNGSSSPINIVELPFFDVELVGVPALGFVGGRHIADQPAFDHLISSSGGSSDPKVVICGGKGGVGKTTTSFALAVTLAAKGHDVALISTDPAHSLGDAVDMDLRGGNLIQCPLIGVPGDTGEGSLSLMEIDPSSALSEFKGVVDELVGGGAGGGPEGSSSEVRSTLQELESIFDTLPAGTDEVVALAKVVNLVKKGKYDRIILDTAPTGHTLRMLSTPGFIADLIDRLLRIADKVNSNAAIKMLMSSASGGNMEQVEAAATSARSRIQKFQFDMFDLEDLFCNPDDTEFLIVTVATELAARESLRLLNDLTFEDPDSPVKVRSIVVNQVLQDDGSDVRTFLSHVGDGQRKAIETLESSLRTFPDPPRITKVPYLDTEPRGVFGLKMLANELLSEE